MACLLSGYFIHPLRRMVVDKLPEGCTLFIWTDCCHSGTMFDLPCNIILKPEVVLDSGLLPKMNIPEGSTVNPTTQKVEEKKNPTNSVTTATASDSSGSNMIFGMIAAIIAAILAAFFSRS